MLCSEILMQEWPARSARPKEGASKGCGCRSSPLLSNDLRRRPSLKSAAPLLITILCLAQPDSGRSLRHSCWLNLSKRANTTRAVISSPSLLRHPYLGTHNTTCIRIDCVLVHSCFASRQIVCFCAEAKPAAGSRDTCGDCLKGVNGQHDESI